MTETPEQTDERRSAAVREALRQNGLEFASHLQTNFGRAIRASDEAAGMVLVSEKVDDPDEPLSWPEWLKITAHKKDAAP